MKIEFNDVWEFIEKYLDDYHSNELVAFVDRCSRYLNDSERCEMFYEDIEDIESTFDSKKEIEDYIAENEKGLFLKACSCLYDKLVKV